MSNAVAAGLLGHDYQGRIFLKYAAQLRTHESNIAKVGYEHNAVRAFDDVIVYYHRPLIDERYNEVHVDFFQVKYQVRQGEEITWEQLMEPPFINATAISFLQRLKDAVIQFSAAALNPRFTIIGPRPIGGELRLLMNNTANAIDLDKFFDGTTRTPRAMIRKAWMEHLELDSEEELRKIIGRLQIRQSGSLEQLREEANTWFIRAGIQPWEETQRANRYDDLPKKLIQSGLKEFDRNAIDKLLTKEGLIFGPPLISGQPPKRIGIRCYTKFAEQMQDETDEMCCFVDCFDDRIIRDPTLWDEKIRPTLEEFLTRVTVGATAIDLTFAAHSTVAFASGWYFGMKSPIDAAPVQTGQVWRPDRNAPKLNPLWQENTVERIGDGPDYALCISSTHNVQSEVSEYVKSSIPTVGSLLHLILPGGHGQNSIRDGTHAFQLAESAVSELARHLPRGSRRCTVHLFISAPNGLVFFLGRMAQRLGRVAMYEYDFNRTCDELYTPSLTFG